jgi:hypothetical protein
MMLHRIGVIAATESIVAVSLLALRFSSYLLAEWTEQRFEDSLGQFLRFPDNPHYSALLSESFDNLLCSLGVRTAKRKIYVDRIAVAISYS